MAAKRVNDETRPVEVNHPWSDRLGGHVGGWRRAHHDETSLLHLVSNAGRAGSGAPARGSARASVGPRRLGEERAQGESIGSGGTESGVVEDAVHGPCTPALGRGAHVGGERGEPLRLVRGEVHARRAVPAKVREPSTEGPRGGRARRRVRRSPHDAVLEQQGVGARRKPALVPRLEHDVARFCGAELAEKTRRAAHVELEARRQLHEQRPELSPQAPGRARKTR